MYGFFAEYGTSATTISILDANGDLQASRVVSIPKASFIQNLTEEMIELSHEQNLYHNDIFAIGVVVDAVKMLQWESKERLQEDLKASFGFTAIVDPNKETVQEKLLTYAS